MIISIHPGVLLLPPKQEVDITSVYQTGNDSLFYCLVRGKLTLRRRRREQLIPDFEFQLEEVVMTNVFSSVILTMLGRNKNKIRN